MTRRLSPALAAALLGLAACAPMPGESAGPPASHIANSPPPAEPPAAVAASPTIPAAPARPVIEPAQLEGLTAVSLKSMLGAPHFLRRDGVAQIWQYYDDACALDLFVYEDHGVERVVHHQIRSRLPGQAPPSRCLGSLLSGRDARDS